MGEFRASVLAQPDAISNLIGTMLEFLKEQGVEPRTAHHVALIVEELLTNVGTHGGCRDRPARVTLRVEPSQVSGEVVDNGDPFDPRTGPEPDLDIAAADRQAGGLGLFLVRNFASALEYVQRNDENYTRFTVPRG